MTTRKNNLKTNQNSTPIDDGLVIVSLTNEDCEVIIGAMGNQKLSDIRDCYDHFVYANSKKDRNDTLKLDLGAVKSIGQCLSVCMYKDVFAVVDKLNKAVETYQKRHIAKTADVVASQKKPT